MSNTIVKPSELLRRALRWIAEERKANPDAKLGPLLDEAGRRFNLSPKDQEGLLALLKGGASMDAPGA